jgi:hypothetical protein
VKPPAGASRRRSIWPGGRIPRLVMLAVRRVRVEHSGAMHPAAVGTPVAALFADRRAGDGSVPRAPAC